MKYLLNIFYVITFSVTSAFSQSAIQSEPFPQPGKGVSEAYSTTFATLIAPGIIHPGVDFEVYAQDAPSLGQQEIFWLVRVQFHDYQSIKFKKTIHLRCGNTIEKYATVSDVKAGKVYSGSTFSGDPELSDLIFDTDCNFKTNRILSVTISDVTGVMYQDDPANPEFIAKQIAIKNAVAKARKEAQQKTQDSINTLRNNAEIAQKNIQLSIRQQQERQLQAENSARKTARLQALQNIQNNYQNKSANINTAVSQVSSTLTNYLNAQADKQQAQADVEAANENKQQEQIPSSQPQPLIKSVAASTLAIDNMLLNQPAPQFESTTSQGTIFKLADYRGKRIILIFWSSLDQKSIDENVNISNDAKFLASKQVTVVSYSQEFSRYQWHTAITDNKLNGIQISDLTGKDNDNSKAYNIKEYPTIFLINANDTIISVSDNYYTIRQQIN